MEIFVVSSSFCFFMQLLDLSGILTVFFSGVIMSHYAWHNVTESSRITTRYSWDLIWTLVVHILNNISM